MYMECDSGYLDIELKIKDPMNFLQFWERLSEQMLTNDKKYTTYPVDNYMQKVTKIIKTVPHQIYVILNIWYIQGC